QRKRAEARLQAEPGQQRYDAGLERPSAVVPRGCLEKLRDRHRLERGTSRCSKIEPEWARLRFLTRARELERPQEHRSRLPRGLEPRAVHTGKYEQERERSASRPHPALSVASSHHGPTLTSWFAAASTSSRKRRKAAYSLGAKRWRSTSSRMSTKIRSPFTCAASVNEPNWVLSATGAGSSSAFHPRGSANSY